MLSNSPHTNSESSQADSPESEKTVSEFRNIVLSLILSAVTLLPASASAKDTKSITNSGAGDPPDTALIMPPEEDTGVCKNPYLDLDGGLDAGADEDKSLSGNEPKPPSSAIQVIGPLAPKGCPECKAPGAELTEKGRNLACIYLSAPQAIDDIDAYSAEMKKVGLNCVVIDIKRDDGAVPFTDNIPGMTGKKHGKIPQIPEIVEAFHNNGIYVIGRLTCFKTIIPADPSMMIKKRNDALWIEKIVCNPTCRSIKWMSPFSDEAHDYLINIALAAQDRVKVDEIQLDYVRVSGKMHKWLVYPGLTPGETPSEAIAEFVKKMDQALNIPLSMDIFGITANGNGDEIGQNLDLLMPYLDAISPMLYLANQNSEMYLAPNAEQRWYKEIRRSIKNLKNQLKGAPIAVRPYIQAFIKRAVEIFSVYFIVNQARAAAKEGINGIVYWNQPGNYGKTYQAMDLMLSECQVKDFADAGLIADAGPEKDDPVCDFMGNIPKINTSHVNRIIPITTNSLNTN